MAYLTDFQYYNNNGVNPQDVNHGSYQYTSLKDVVNNFILSRTGEHSLIDNEPRHKILFHAKRAIQELNYDAFKEIKVLTLDINEQLNVVLPPDCVSWVRINLYKDGYIRPMTENQQVLSSLSYLKDNNNNLMFDQDGNVLSPQYSQLDLDRVSGQKKSIYLNEGNPYHGFWGWEIDGYWYFDVPRYGLNTSTANSNPTFRIDKRNGVINFSSGTEGDSVIIEYISDGMEQGEDSLISVNKLFEDFVYAFIEYEILDSKQGVQEYIVHRKRKKRKALYNNAKIRMMKPIDLLMSLRGQDKIIK